MARNHYFTGKLLVERDFTNEQHYHMGKIRRHNKYLHGMGVTCGLQVREHPSPECQAQYVVIEPGTAIDCCGREIYVEYEQYLDVRTLFEAWWQRQYGAETQPDDQARDFLICLSYTECPTEEIPALFDDCGCDDTAVQPNRIQETFELGIRPWQDPVVDPGSPDPDPLVELRRCWARVMAAHVDQCHTCDEACVPLAVIRNYVYGQPIRDPDSPNPPVWIDNGVRPLLPSTTALYELIRCLFAFGEETGTGDGGIDDLRVIFVPCDQPQNAVLTTSGGLRTLELTLHEPCSLDGGNGIDRVEVEECADCEGDEEPTATIRTEPDGTRVLVLRFPCCQDPATPPRPERVEPYVSGISWQHAGRHVPGLFFENGLLIAFRGLVQTQDINRHTLQLLAEMRTRNQAGLPLDCWCEIPGIINGVELDLIDQGDGTDVIQGINDPNPATPFVNGARWQPEAGVQLAMDLTYRVVLKGDLIVGDNGQSVDGNHLALWLPKRASGDGIPGGTFESWFDLTDRISINRATAAELATVPGIGSDLAGAIVAYRDAAGAFSSLDELTNISGIAQRKLAQLRPYLRL
jgi:competence ComEA-like helix-hairpin-helix protein